LLAPSFSANLPIGVLASRRGQQSMVPEEEEDEAVGLADTPATAPEAEQPAPPDIAELPPAAIPAPPTHPAPTEAPTTPANGRLTVSDVFVVDVDPTPGAAKFISTVSEAGSTLATLGASEVSDGMLELSRQSTTSMKYSFEGFKNHALDLAVTATSDAPEGEQGWKCAARQAEWRKLAQLPLAAFYAVMALICLCAFAVIYYPKQYGPMILDKARTKLIEWHLDEKATQAKTLVGTYGAQAYEAAASSQIAAKGAETIGKAYTTVVSQPAVVAISAKTGEAAEQLKKKVAEKLVELREANGSSSPVGGSV